jgi:osmotically-inducible protein OsmY
MVREPENTKKEVFMKLSDKIHSFSLKRIWILLTVFLLTAAFPISGSAAYELTDAAIENAVEQQLLADQVIPAYRITPECTRGVVSLKGTVSSILTKERALNIAETVKGVRSVINLIEVSPVKDKSDTRLENDAMQALLMNPATSLFDISVSADEKTVTLTGTVDSFREKQLAGTVVKGVSGVEALENKISISYAVERTDQEIQAEIEQGLLWDALVDHELVEVQVKNGRVTLAGTIGSAAEKTRTISDSWVAGVKEIDAADLDVARWARDDDLRASKYVPKSDEQIENAVMMSLTLDPRISSTADIEIMSSDGTVTLKGTVDYLQARRAAAQDARNTVGVLQVRNYLKIAPLPVTINDDELEESIREALDRDTYVDEYDIVVNVRSGVAELYGRVNSFFEKMRAEDLASTIAGIYYVNNNIGVNRDWSLYRYRPYRDLDNFSEEDYDWYHFTPPEPNKSDWQIRKDIRDELWWSPFVEESRITVSVEDGKATLTGTVYSKMEYDAAAENALEAGAVKVDNRLEIASLLPPKKN